MSINTQQHASFCGVGAHYEGIFGNSLLKGVEIPSGVVVAFEKVLSTLGHKGHVCGFSP